MKRSTHAQDQPTDALEVVHVALQGLLGVFPPCLLLCVLPCFFALLVPVPAASMSTNSAQIMCVCSFANARKQGLWSARGCELTQTAVSNIAFGWVDHDRSGQLVSLEALHIQKLMRLGQKGVLRQRSREEHTDCRRRSRRYRRRASSSRPGTASKTRVCTVSSSCACTRDSSCGVAARTLSEHSMRCKTLLCKTLLTETEELL